MGTNMKMNCRKETKHSTTEMKEKGKLSAVPKPRQERPLEYRLGGPVVKVSALIAKDTVSNAAFATEHFPGRVTPVTYKLAPQWLPCQAPGTIESAPGLADLGPYAPQGSRKLWK